MVHSQFIDIKSLSSCQCILSLFTQAEKKQLADWIEKDAMIKK